MRASAWSLRAVAPAFAAAAVGCIAVHTDVARTCAAGSSVCVRHCVMPLEGVSAHTGNGRSTCDFARVSMRVLAARSVCGGRVVSGGVLAVPPESAGLQFWWAWRRRRFGGRQREAAARRLSHLFLILQFWCKLLRSKRRRGALFPRPVAQMRPPALALLLALALLSVQLVTAYALQADASAAAARPVLGVRAAESSTLAAADARSHSLLSETH